MVDPVEELPRPAHPQVAEKPLVVDPGGIDENTGPSGRSSIGFSTGSVVVPATAEVMETCWRVTALRRSRLADVAAPEDADLESPCPSGAGCYGHSSSSGSDPRAQCAHRFGAGKPIELPGGQNSLFDHEIADGAAGSRRLRRDSGGLFIAHHLDKGGRRGRFRLRRGSRQRASSASIPANAPAGKRRARAGQQVDLAEEAMGDERQERVQLEDFGGAGGGERRIQPDRPAGPPAERTRGRRVHLARHDGGSRPAGVGRRISPSPPPDPRRAGEGPRTPSRGRPRAP